MSLLDKEMERQIFDLTVRCPLAANGCGWTGELRHLDKHVSSSREGTCLYVEVECSYGCGQSETRLNIIDHEKGRCPKLPVEVQMKLLKEKTEEMYLKLTENHRIEIDNLKSKIAKQEQEISELKKAVLQLNQEPFTVTIPVFSPSILLLMPKIPNGNIPGISYYPSDKYIKISANSKEELEARKQQFLYEFEILLPLLQKDIFEVLPHFPKSVIESVVTTCNRTFRACYVINHQSSVELISADASEHKLAKSILSEKLSSKIQELRFAGNVECKLTLKVASIADEKVDVIIIPVDSKPSSLAGKFAKSVNINEGPFEVIITNSTPKYKSKSIIYILNNSDIDLGVQYDLLCQSIHKSLHEIVSHRVNKSVAIPAESSGKNAFKSSFIVPAVIQSIKMLLDEEAQNHDRWCLNNIQINFQDDLSSFDNEWFYSYVNYLSVKYHLQ
jgi:hypothetical protein